MKYLGIDYGTKRIGVAVSDPEGRVAFPIAVLPHKEALAALATLIEQEGIGEVVVGESRNLSGQPNPVQTQIEEFGRELQELTKVQVAYSPEFFTSALAARQFAPEENSRKQNPEHKNLDASAAALILQGFLDRLNK